MNKQVFFSAVKKTLFGGKLTQSQVSGMDSILDSFELNGVTDNCYRAYMLATVYHECAKRCNPLRNMVVKHILPKDMVSREAIENLQYR